MPPPLVPESLLNRPFTLAEAKAAGLSRHALRGPEWRNIFQTVWAHCETEETREFRFAAARLVLPSRAVTWGLTAAWLYGADVRREDDFDVFAGMPKGGRVRSREGLVVSQETLQPRDIWTIDGVQLTSPVRTVFDSLRLLRGDMRLIVADALTHLGRTDVEEVRRYFAGQRRLRNLRVGAALVDQIEPKSESPMETRLRIGLVAAGLPQPVAQWVLRDHLDRFVARLDLAYPEQKVAVEYDGAWHWERRREDDRRRDAARALGWIVIVVSADDLFGSPERLYAQVAAALRSRAA